VANGAAKILAFQFLGGRLSPSHLPARRTKSCAAPVGAAPTTIRSAPVRQPNCAAGVDRASDRDR
jgi:hypothetical protein